MATLADINSELSSQGNLLEETRDGIASVASTVAKQLDFFTGGKLTDLEASRESRPSTSAGGLGAGIAAAGAAGFTRGKAALAGLVAGVSDFLLAAGTGLLAGAMKLVRGAGALALFPFIKNFVDDMVAEAGEFTATLMDGIFGYEMSDAEKNLVRDALSSGLTTSIVGILFGLGAKRSLIAGLIAAGFTALSNRFPELGDNVLQYMRDIGLGKIADLIEQNPETTKMALSLGLTGLVSAVGALIFKSIGALFGATIAAIGALPLTVIAGGLIVGGVTYKYYTDDEFKKMIDDALEPMRTALRDKVRDIEELVVDTITNAARRLYNFITGVDTSKFSEEDVSALNDLDQQIDDIQRSRSNVDLQSMSYDERMKFFAREDPTGQKLAELTQQRNDLLARMRSGARNPEYAGVDADDYAAMVQSMQSVPTSKPTPSTGNELAELQRGLSGDPFLDESAYGAGGFVGDINSNNSTQVVNQSTNILGSLGTTQDTWNPRAGMQQFFAQNQAL